MRVGEAALTPLYPTLKTFRGIVFQYGAQTLGEGRSAHLRPEARQSSASRALIVCTRTAFAPVIFG